MQTNTSENGWHPEPDYVPHWQRIAMLREHITNPAVPLHKGAAAVRSDGEPS